jgi:hypothetical protein
VTHLKLSRALLHPSSTDHGTIVQADELAVVVRDNGEISVIVPDGAEEAELHPRQVALAICAMRLHDEDFIRDLLELLDEEELFESDSEDFLDDDEEDDDDDNEGEEG